MSRYIDVEKVQRLIAETGNRHSRNGGDIPTCGSICADLIIGVYELPTDDVAEVRRGRWEPYLNEGPIVKCSVCGSRYAEPWHYCPRCGSRMDLGEEK